MASARTPLLLLLLLVFRYDQGRPLFFFFFSNKKFLSRNVVLSCVMPPPPPQFDTHSVVLNSARLLILLLLFTRRFLCFPLNYPLSLLGSSDVARSLSNTLLFIQPLFCVFPPIIPVDIIRAGSPLITAQEMKFKSTSPPTKKKEKETSRLRVFCN